MADDLLNALRRNLEMAEKAGLTDRVKALKARIAELEKPAKAESAPAPVVKKAPAKKAAAKKASKK